MSVGAGNKIDKGFSVCMFMYMHACMYIYINANASLRRWWRMKLKIERSPLFPWPQDDRWIAGIIEIYQAFEAAALLVSGDHAEILFSLFLGDNILFITKVLLWQSDVVRKSKKVSGSVLKQVFCTDMFLLFVIVFCFGYYNHSPKTCPCKRVKVD